MDGMPRRMRLKGSGPGAITVNGNGITVRQLLTPDELQGRVNATGRMIAWVSPPFGHSPAA
jgi:hypothetical protein